MIAHTPGPWHAIDDYIHGMRGSFSVPVGCAYHEKRGSATSMPDVPLAEGHANACLMAAAPDLLNALELAVTTIERIGQRRGPFSSFDGTLRVAKAAILKASQHEHQTHPVAVSRCFQNASYLPRWPKAKGQP